jgi:hypothetical protein
MNDEILDELTHGIIEGFGKMKIEARNSRLLLRENSINWDKLRELLPEKPKPFDIAAIQDETHLRKIIMDRVLETAAQNVTVSVTGGPSVPIAELPEDQKAEYLNKFILDVLDSDSGPGPVLRRSIALEILNYRMRNRLKKLLPTLNPSSPKSKRVGQGIDYIEKLIKSGMFYFEAWTFFGDSPRGKQSDLAK